MRFAGGCLISTGMPFSGVFSEWKVATLCFFFKPQANDVPSTTHRKKGTVSVKYTSVFFSSVTISSRIAGLGELFSSDFQACAQSPRSATRCSLGSVSCSCDAPPRTAVRERALPVASSPLRAWSHCSRFSIMIGRVRCDRDRS